ncbi:MAG TPA: SDR family NAD(P)-dependent oxidoreductase [Dongiaceae bacterium]|nr:SDR family NAD(P)-dependent oxidoreductase [Dongiaceae bacterium]
MNETNKAVLITGASSGIGRACVLEMSRAGWRVFATVRKATDGERLLREAGPNAQPIIMDVQSGASIVTAAREVESQLAGRGLDGLVNNAGIGTVRPLEYASADDMREIFEINVFGQIAVTQAFSRLLRQAKGRIANITSVGVNIAIPFGGLLNASKSAFSMLSDTMRLELRPSGIRVSSIEPGAISTPAVEKTLGDIKQVIASLPPEGQAQYGAILRHFGQLAYEREKDGSAPEVVSRAVHHALTSKRPRIRYRVGKHAKLLATLPKVLPESLLDSLRLRMFGLSGAEPRRRSRRGRLRIVPAGSSR